MPLFSRKVFGLVFPLLLSFLTLASAQATLSTTDWEMLRPEGEEFSVLMPKGSTFGSSKEPYHKMELNTRMYVVKSQAGPVFAVVSLSGIKSNPAAYSEMQRLNSYVDAFKNFFSAKLLGKDAVAKLTFLGEKRLQGNAGREYRITIGGLSGITQVYATRKRFYAVVFLNTKKEDAIQEQFLSSFLIPEKIAEAPAAVASQNPPATPPPTPPANQPSPGEAQQSDAVANANDDTKRTEAEAGSSQPSKRAPISGGVLNGKAIILPKPEYPAEAKAAGATGTVAIQVIIDELGNVISAHAVSGHPLLQQASVSAARQAKFSPTSLLGEPVKVSGVITYNFVRQ